MSYATYSYTNADFINSPKEISLDTLTSTINNLNLSSILAYINSNVEPDSFSVDLFFNTELSSVDKITLNDAIAKYSHQNYTNLFAKITDTKPNATNSGDFISGDWRTRILNTIQGNQNFVSIANNQFALQPGTYSINISAISNNVGNNQLRLYDITNSAVIDVGINGYSKNTNNLINLTTEFTISSVTTYEIQHYGSITQLNWGFGLAIGTGESEIYLTCFIQNHS